MATIGNFSTDGDGFTGTLSTLTLKAKAAILPNRKVNDRAPDFRVYAAGIEVGAAWRRTSQAQRDYLSIKVDDPSFPDAIYCRLITLKDGAHRLIWDR